MTSKTIYTDQGTFIVDEELEAEFDPASMLPETESAVTKSTATDSVEINGETFLGHLKTYTVIKNNVTGKTVVKVVLVTA